MSTSTDPPIFSTLEEEDARAILARNRVGRIAFSIRDRVDIQPIHFAYDGDWLFGRTEIGAKLTSLVHQPACALEVDEVHDLFHWDSVVVRGTFRMLDPENGPVDLYDRALARLRQLVPGTLTSRDPAPRRVILFAIRIDEITGRSARSAHD
jgi:nitroimidazol reductase NimA-like FMN-containing flavoprotein (pyridoxamine 5'-phosphate oxidase superfamily)